MYATLNKQKWYKIKISDQSCKMSDEFINVEVTLLLGFHFTWIKSNQLLGCNYTDAVDISCDEAAILSAFLLYLCIALELLQVRLEFSTSKM